MKRFEPKLDTEVTDNALCAKCPNSESRHLDSDGICSRIVSSADGLPLRCVGDWANDKIYYLLQYFQIFTQGMSQKWGKLRYIEVCSGPGRCSTRDGKEQNGTALSIVKNELFPLLADALFIDYSPRVIDLLTKRIAAAGAAAHAHPIVGDYNNPDSIIKAIQAHSPDSLTLCFIDPTDCSLPFDTVRRIFGATQGRCDFLISFFDGLDFRRNAVNATVNPRFASLREKYERFLGTPDFFDRKEVVEAARNGRSDILTMLFRQHYADKLRGLGLEYQDWKPIKNYYCLLFSSGNSRGLDFWKKATKYDPIGQAQMEFFL